jgi:hypothetical protein
LTGAEATAGVGDGGLRIEALVDQLQEAHTPGDGVAMVLQAEQVAIGRGRVDADEHRMVGLKELIVGPDANAGQVAPSADRPRRFDGAVDDVVDRTQGDLPVEEVAEQRDDGPVRTVANQHQSQDQLTQPGLGYRQVEEDVFGRWCGVEGVGQGVRCGVGLLIEELPADLMLPSQLGDRVSPGEDLYSEIPPLGRQEPLGRPGDEVGNGDGSQVRLRQTEGRCSLAVHACFLRVGRGIESPRVNMEETGILENPDSVSGLLPDFEPCLVLCSLRVVSTPGFRRVTLTLADPRTGRTPIGVTGPGIAGSPPAIRRTVKTRPRVGMSSPIR